MVKDLKYIFITGGVISSLGKGVTTSVIATLLKCYGYNPACVKCDAYVNIDAGTMNPTEHGEVFVTEDGIETDQDLGNYERFLHENLSILNYLTTGQIYQEVIKRERNLEYKGKCVEVVPHVPEELIRRLNLAAEKKNADFVLAEIGGTVGEYQNILFLEADRILKYRYPDKVINIHVSYLPIPKTIGEMKTKPVQYSVRTLNSAGIQPDFVIGRSELKMDKKRKEKISLFCNVDIEYVISNPDVRYIYELPIIFEKQNFTQKLLKLFGLKRKTIKTDFSLSEWKKLIKKIYEIELSNKKVKIGIVGKYFTTGKFTLEDSYISVIEAIKHSCWENSVKPDIYWIDSEEFERNPKKLRKLKKFDGVIVPGGFGSRGVEGKIKTIQFLRENKIPFLGLCFGMQLACIEFARNVLKLKGANTTEIDKKTPYPIIDILPEQKKNLRLKHFGATMRLGAYKCSLIENTLAFKSYKKHRWILKRKQDYYIMERHRHRYEFNNYYKKMFEKAGMIFSGIYKKRDLIEIIELKNHPFFIGTQFHPEFKSRPFTPHPLFIEFINASLINSKNK